jgi:hypothetical protein
MANGTEIGPPRGQVDDLPAWSGQVHGQGGQRRRAQHVRPETAVPLGHRLRGMPEELSEGAQGAPSEHEVDGIGVARAGVEREALRQAAALERRSGLLARNYQGEARAGDSAWPSATSNAAPA